MSVDAFVINQSMINKSIKSQYQRKKSVNAIKPKIIQWQWWF